MIQVLVMLSWLCVQRRDSRVEARALQQDFLQKAKQDLETFQRNCSFAAAAHGLSSSAGLDACSSQDAPAVDGQLDEQPPSRHADSDSTVAGGAAYRCAQVKQKRISVLIVCFACSEGMHG